MRNRLLLVGLILLLTVPLALLLHGFVREVVAVVILYFLWIGDLIFKTFPQSFFWALFLILALVIAGSSLVGGRQRIWQGREVEVVREGRVRVLARWIQRAGRGAYFRWNLAHHLGDLTLEALAYREGNSPEQMRELLRSGELDVPPEIRAYLQAGSMPWGQSFERYRRDSGVWARPGAGTASGFARLTGVLSSLGRRLRPGARSSMLDLDPEGVVRFLEDQLEVVNDDRNR
jgi:hypothetical protein